MQETMTPVFSLGDFTVYRDRHKRITIHIEKTPLRVRRLSEEGFIKTEAIFGNDWEKSSKKIQLPKPGDKLYMKPEEQRRVREWSRRYALDFIAEAIDETNGVYTLKQLWRSNSERYVVLTEEQPWAWFLNMFTW